MASRAGRPVTGKHAPIWSLTEEGRHRDSIDDFKDLDKEGTVLLSFWRAGDANSAPTPINVVTAAPAKIRPQCQFTLSSKPE
jgi:hypothetical protein